MSELMTLSIETIIPQYSCIATEDQFTIVRYYDIKNDRDSRIDLDK